MSKSVWAEWLRYCQMMAARFEVWNQLPSSFYRQEVSHCDFGNDLLRNQKYGLCSEVYLVSPNLSGLQYPKFKALFAK